MKITANRQLVGDYGMLRPDESCDVPFHIGKELLSKGLARPYELKAVTPEQPMPRLETLTPSLEQPTVKLEAPTPKLENKRK